MPYDLSHHLGIGGDGIGIHHQDHAQAHVEGPEHLVVRDPSPLADEPEDWRLCPRFPLQACPHSFWQATGKVAEDAAAGDVCRTLPANRLQRVQVRAMGLEELLAKRASELSIRLRQAKVCD